MLHKGSTILHSSNWDNLRFVLAVAEDGSVSAAARRLGVNHATVLRRVAAFEEEQGGPVFEKTATGYRVLPDRATVIDAARDVANSVLVVERLMHGARAPLRGVVRVASTDSLCQMVLPPLIAELNRLSPELRVDLMSSNGHLDFSRLQADITVRPAERLPEDMTGEICTRFAFHPYGAPGVENRWLGLTGPLARSNPARWITANVAPEAIVAGADSFLVLREMARAGMGLAVLPGYVGDSCPGLERRDGLMPASSVPVWVATYGALRQVPRIRIVCDRIREFLAASSVGEAVTTPAR